MKTITATLGGALAATAALLISVSLWSGSEVSAEAPETVAGSPEPRGDPGSYRSVQLKTPSQAKVLVVGDSQISVGAGRSFQEFFADFDRRCGPILAGSGATPTFQTDDVDIIGVRSTSLSAWTSREGKSKDMVCEVDQKFGVNAATYGIEPKAGRSYVQIGRGAAYQFCSPNRSPFEAMFADDYYQPDLILLHFLGNGADRWARNKRLAVQDVRETVAQLPKTARCVFFTTTPVYETKTNDMRAEAQDVIQAAFEEAGSRCLFVDGFSDDARAIIEGNPAFFSRNDAGEVRDPLHPNYDASRAFFRLNTPKLCRAIAQAMKG